MLEVDRRRVSDVDGKLGARTYTILFGDESWEVDLTPAQAKPILDLARLGRPPVGKYESRNLSSRVLKHLDDLISTT